MVGRLLLAGLGILVFIAAAGILLGRLNDSHFARAEASRDACYAAHGIDLDSSTSVPEAVRRECTEPMRYYDDHQLRRYLTAATFGLFCAAVAAGVGAIGLRSRRRRSP